MNWASAPQFGVLIPQRVSGDSAQWSNHNMEALMTRILKDLTLKKQEITTVSTDVHYNFHSLTVSVRLMGHVQKDLSSSTNQELLTHTHDAWQSAQHVIWMTHVAVLMVIYQVSCIGNIMLLFSLSQMKTTIYPLTHSLTHSLNQSTHPSIHPSIN